MFYLSPSSSFILRAVFVWLKRGKGKREKSRDNAFVLYLRAVFRVCINLTQGFCCCFVEYFNFLVANPRLHFPQKQGNKPFSSPSVGHLKGSEITPLSISNLLRTPLSPSSRPVCDRSTMKARGENDPERKEKPQDIYDHEVATTDHSVQFSRGKKQTVRDSFIVRVER